MFAARNISVISLKWSRENKTDIWANVECPCHSADGKVLDPDTALRHILGQTSAIGIDKNVAERVVKGWERGEKLVMKLGYAVTKMFICWQHSCMHTFLYTYIYTAPRGSNGQLVCRFEEDRA